MSSQRQIAANRVNALKSTGPKSPEGKARVSRNAVTHGLCSRKALLPNEDSQRMRAQLQALRRALMPQGAGEESLVALMARDLRKLARVDRYEAGIYEWHHFGILAKRARRKASFYEDKLELEGYIAGDLPRAVEKKYDKARAKAKRMKNRRKASLPTTGLTFIRGAGGGDALSKLSRYSADIERSYLKKLDQFQRLQAQRAGRVPPPSGGGDENGSDNPVGLPARPHEAD